MDRQVFPEQGPLIRFELTAGMSAGICVMSFHVLIQATFGRECGITDLAFERLVSCMHCLMDPQIELCLTLFFAERTDKLLLLLFRTFAVRRFHVALQMRLQPKRFRTVVSLTGENRLKQKETVSRDVRWSGTYPRLVDHAVLPQTTGRFETGRTSLKHAHMQQIEVDYILTGL